MKKRRWFSVLTISCLIALIWFFVRNSNKTKTELLAVKSKATTIIAPSTQAGLATPLKTAEGQRKRFMASYLTPISFYGKVVDQHGNPVDAANIILAANDKPLGGSATEYTRKSDASGLFSITGIRGLTLGVEVSKFGYLGIPPDDTKVTSSGVFEYGLSSATGPRLPDKENPAVFTLHKIGILEPLVKIGEKNYRMQRNGTPLNISLDQKNGHQVILRCWTKDLERPEGQNKYDWNFEITVTGGGLMLRKDELAFEATTEGYQPNDTINMPSTLPFGFGGWSSHAKRSYFVRFEDQTYARVNMEMVAGGDHFVIWESFYNPKPGSRNLEFDATKPNPTP